MIHSKRHQCIIVLLSKDALLVQAADVAASSSFWRVQGASALLGWVRRPDCSHMVEADGLPIARPIGLIRKALGLNGCRICMQAYHWESGACWKSPRALAIAQDSTN